MEFLGKIFAILKLSEQDKEKALQDLSNFIAIKTANELGNNLSQDKKALINKDNAQDILKNSYNPETVQEYTRKNFRDVLQEYIEHLVLGATGEQQKEILEVLKEFSQTES